MKQTYLPFRLQSVASLSLLVLGDLKCLLFQNLIRLSKVWPNLEVEVRGVQPEKANYRRYVEVLK